MKTKNEKTEITIKNKKLLSTDTEPKEGFNFVLKDKIKKPKNISYHEIKPIHVLTIQDSHLQDSRLQEFVDNKSHVKIYLVNGIKIDSVIQAFDKYVLDIVDKDKGRGLIYKHSIATVLPAGR